MDAQQRTIKKYLTFARVGAIVTACAVVAVSLLWGCSDFMRRYNIPEDSWVFEDWIYDRTGIQIDISEKSPEGADEWPTKHLNR